MDPQCEASPPSRARVLPGGSTTCPGSMPVNLFGIKGSSSSRIFQSDRAAALISAVCLTKDYTGYQKSHM
jgi:hypothetical protein